jgi:hypothetical protein
LESTRRLGWGSAFFRGAKPDRELRRGDSLFGSALTRPWLGAENVLKASSDERNPLMKSKSRAAFGVLCLLFYGSVLAFLVCDILGFGYFLSGATYSFFAFLGLSVAEGLLYFLGKKRGRFFFWPLLFLALLNGVGCVLLNAWDVLNIPGNDVLRSVGIIGYWASVVLSALAEMGFLLSEKLSRTEVRE